MSKQAISRQLLYNEANAKLKAIRVSPQKLNLIAGLIRGYPVLKAINHLVVSKKRVAKEVHQLLMSAIANAENNHALNVDNLIVKQVWVGKAFVIKRSNARARGRGVKILKPFSQMNIIVSEQKVNV